VLQCTLGVERVTAGQCWRAGVCRSYAWAVKTPLAVHALTLAAVALTFIHFALSIRLNPRTPASQPPAAAPSDGGGGGAARKGGASIFIKGASKRRGEAEPSQRNGGEARETEPSAFHACARFW
jgi:hypothetical protein